ncbi:hypothetical protein Dsin_027172, partial [Dipteronia sinensis]
PMQQWDVPDDVQSVVVLPPNVVNLADFCQKNLNHLEVKKLYTKSVVDTED